MKCALASLCLSGWIAFQATPQDTSLIGPFINLGAVGVCLVVLALWYRRKDQRYEERMDEPMAERIQEQARSGRPPRQLQLARKVIQRVWSHDPRRHGYRALVWTVPMLRCEIRQQTGQDVGRHTVRRAFQSLRYRYKRPRLVLARRLTTWRQAKGGLNAG